MFLLKNPFSMEDNILFVSKRYNLPVDIILELEKDLKTKQVKKKDVIIKKGEFQNNFFYLKSGIVRAFSVDNNGKEFTRSLFTSRTVIVPIRAMVTQTKTNLTFDCLTDCEVFVGDFDNFIASTKTDIRIANVYNRILEYNFIDMESRVFELTLSAQEKYEQLRERVPNIDNLIPQYQIANYLNITNVQLSRIRKKMLGK